MQTLADMGFKEGDTIPLDSYTVLDFPEWFSEAQRSRYYHKYFAGDIVEPLSFSDNSGEVQSYNEKEMLVVFVVERITNNRQWIPICCLTPVINNKSILPKGV